MPSGIYKRIKPHGFQKGHSINKGRTFTVKHRQKLSNSHKGKVSPNKGKKASIITKQKQSNAKIGKNGLLSNKYYKDRTKLKKAENKQNDVQYIYWRNDVRKRDKYKCRLLNCDCKGRLETHHIFNWIDNPELRYVLTNGITLCAFHHPRGREKEKRMIPIFQELLSVSKE
jgi:hypothetical protein